MTGVPYLYLDQPISKAPLWQRCAVLPTLSCPHRGHSGAQCASIRHPGGQREFARWQDSLVARVTYSVEGRMSTVLGADPPTREKVGLMYPSRQLDFKD